MRGERTSGAVGGSISYDLNTTGCATNVATCRTGDKDRVVVRITDGPGDMDLSVTDCPDI